MPTRAPDGGRPWQGRGRGGLLPWGLRSPGLCCQAPGIQEASGAGLAPCLLEEEHCPARRPPPNPLMLLQVPTRAHEQICSFSRQALPKALL